MFADTDFILALIKSSDWLKQNALTILNKHKGRITTSVSVMVELALVCNRLRMPIKRVFANAFELISVNEETYVTCLRAATYMKKYGLNVFDAFHAAYCLDDKIISSDNAYEKVGLERIKLERN